MRALHAGPPLSGPWSLPCAACSLPALSVREQELHEDSPPGSQAGSCLFALVSLLHVALGITLLADRKSTGFDKDKYE